MVTTPVTEHFNEKTIYTASDLKQRPKGCSVSNLRRHLTVVKLKCYILILKRFK